MSEVLCIYVKTNVSVHTSYDDQEYAYCQMMCMFAKRNSFVPTRDETHSCLLLVSSRRLYVRQKKLIRAY